MPNCFQLIDKTTEQAEKFSVIDDKLCAHLGVEPHPKHYYRGWYDSIGLALAVGKSFEEILATVQEPHPTYGVDEESIKIVKWLDEHYTSTAWYAPKF